MPKQPTALVANETGHTANPGCRAVRRGLDRLLTLGGVQTVGTLPLGHSADPFDDLSPSKEYRLIRSDADTFARGNPDPAPLDLDAWYARKATMVDDRDLAQKFDDAQLLVVNGEGSIHHNLPRALALCALMALAAERGLKVALVNATLQGMSRDLLRTAFAGVDFCHVREAASLETVKPIIPDAFALPDLAVLALRTLPAPFRTAAHRASRDCMITPGVLASEATIRALIEAVRAVGLTPWYLLIGDGGERRTATQVCDHEGVAMVDAGTRDLESLMGILSHSGLAVSGRHHVNIFLMQCGVPLVPLPSNTWKIEGMLASTGYPLAPVARPADLTATIARADAERESLSQAMRAGILTSQEEAETLVARFCAWT